MQDYHARLLEIITAVQEEIILTDDFPAAFKNMLGALQKLTGSEFGFVAEVLFDDDAPYLKTYAISDISWGKGGAEIYNKHIANGFEFRNLNSLLGQTVATGEPYISNEPAIDPNRAGLPPGHPPVQAFLSLPLRRASKVVGVIGLANRPGGYEEHWREHLRPLTQTCGNLIVALQVEQERRLAEETLRDALDTIPDGFAIFDENDRLAICNDAYRVHYAASAPAIREKASFEEIIRYGLERGQYPEAGEGHEEREAWLQERLEQHRNPSGTVLQKLETGTWLRIRERRTARGHIVGLRTDVTELKEAEEAIRRSKAEASRLALVASRTDNGVIITDAAGFIVWVNDGFTKISGYTLNEAIRVKPSQLMQGAGTDPDAIVYMRSCLAAGAPFQLELINYHKDGSPYWISLDVQPIREDGKVTNFIAIQRDITRQKSVERNLQQRETKFRSLFDMAPVGILLTAADGRFVDANDTFLSMVGATKDAMMGQHIGRLFDAEESGDGGRILDDFQSEMDERGRYGPVECRLDCLTGPRKTVLLNATKVNLMEQMPLTWSIVQDISERKRIERVKNEFISVISHELGTPLTALVGSLGLVKEGALGDVPAQINAMLRIAHGNATRLADLVKDILEMEKIHSGTLKLDFEDVNVEKLVAVAVERNRAFADERQIRLQLEAPAVPVMVWVDCERMTQVITNLLSNAVKFSEAGQQVVVRIAQGDNRVCVSVEDQGRGIPEEMHGQIFRKFFQVDSSDSRAHNGSGLGLSICQAIVEQHGSKIVVVSGAGNGATFSFDLFQTMPETRADPDEADALDDISGIEKHAV